MTLKELRQQRGLSQTALAGAAHVNVLTLGLIEQRRLIPSANQSLKIAAALSVEPSVIDEFANHDLAPQAVSQNEEHA